MTEDSSTSVIVIDNGSASCKSGFSGEDSPRCIVPWIPVSGNIQRNSALRQSVKNTIIYDWDGMEDMWSHIFHTELKIEPNEHAVLLNESPRNPRSCREKTTQIMFERFNTPGLYLANQSTLALYATANVTGMVIDLGDTVTHTVPIYSGYAIPHTINYTPSNLTEYLMRILTEDYYSFTRRNCERQIATDIKKICYVALDFEEELALSTTKVRGATVGRTISPLDKDFTLPDGEIITVGNQRIRCPEVLFQPNLAGFDNDGIHEMAFNSIMKSDITIREDLYTNIVLAGGTSLFPGLADRILKEMVSLVPSTAKVKIHAPSERQYLTWIGGSILASLSSFPNMCISQQEYNDSGPSIIHRKCFI